MSIKTIKILILGDEKVGKSSLYEKFINRKFLTNYSQSKTIQFKQTNLNLNGETINLKFFDTPGNEEKHKIYTSVYVDTTGIIVMFDLTNKNSFENIFKKWIPDFFNFLKIKPTDCFPLIIIGNFSDLSKKRVFEKKEIEEKLKEVSKYTNYFFYQEISIKSDSIPNFMKKVLLFINTKPEISPPSSDNKQISENEINSLKEKIKKLEEENKKEREEKEKNKVILSSLNDKVQMLEQVKMILTEKDKKDKNEMDKLKEEIKKLLEEKQKLTEEMKNQEKNSNDDTKKERQLIEERNIFNERIMILEQQKKLLAEDNKKRIEIEKKDKEEKEKLNEQIKKLNENIKKLVEEKVISLE